MFRCKFSIIKQNVVAFTEVPFFFFFFPLMPFFFFGGGGEGGLEKIGPSAPSWI